MIELLSCLSCSGKGETFYICENRYIKCGSCKGTGTQERDAAWEAQGEELRRRRIAADLSLREIARKAGVSVVAISDAERGRSDPSAFLPEEPKP